MSTETLNENDKARAKGYDLEEVVAKKVLGTDYNYKHEYVTIFVIAHTLLQLGWLYGFYVLLFHAKLVTFLWAYSVGFCSSIAAALGSHRYYSHKSYKASKPLEYALVFFQTISGQNSVYRWAREHRLHHKYSDTDADPHNSNRGFFFSHMGWLMVKKHPLVKEKIKQIDVTDLKNDKLVMFQYKYFLILYFFIGFLLPVSVPIIFFNESFYCSFFVAWNFMYVTTLHFTWTINSWAHKFGTKHYDKRIKPTDTWVTWCLTAGEGWHNYHHSFPWDCRSSELGTNGGLSTMILEFFEKVGLASNLKTASLDVVHGHRRRHGDEAFRKESGGKTLPQNGGAKTKTESLVDSLANLPFGDD
ncbi:(11Z)-hexadec-11-enoyl-CoA conjugase-like [Prorops nasuta]|uniref:(11Z)-hexadec-11-enoyl-CoA conjugase-like n=1 Tax=Prorops nasuta TaxID=863751 RepID=UPI0034CD3FC8